MIKSGRIRAYAVANPQRLKALPDIPTFAEGGLANLRLAVWHGLSRRRARRSRCSTTCRLRSSRR